ncbi:MAG: hypothetical protein RBR74_04330 [Ignavibacteriaceae bacterium]|jgi:hypothetical protein|nr:hypothetical protein [Ignavibacteriaceae bacterium]
MTKSLLRRAKAFYRVNPVYNDCPSCKASGSLLRSHNRNLKEKLYSKFSFYKYYRCKQCGWRGALKIIRFKQTSLLVILAYLLLIFAAGFITHMILKRLL